MKAAVIRLIERSYVNRHSLLYKVWIDRRLVGYKPTLSP
jgi:hypothetical protein